jgi:hypothetical protein
MAERDQVQIAVYPLSANPIDYSAHTTAKPPAIGKDTVAVSYRRMYIAAFPLRECGFFCSIRGLIPGRLHLRSPECLMI